MSILGLEDETLRTEAVQCSDTRLSVTLKDGRRIAVPLWRLPRLYHATPEQRAARRRSARSELHGAFSF